MDNRLLLVKSITLLYRESQLVHKTDNSADMVRTVIEAIPVPEIGIGIHTEREIISCLRETVIEMCANSIDYEYDRAILLQHLKLNCQDDEKLFSIIEEGIDHTLPESQLKRTIVNLRKSISNHFKEQKISEILSKASYSFKHHRDKIKDIGDFINSLVAQLEPLQMTTNMKDPAIVSDIDLGDDKAVQSVFAEVKNANDSNGIMKLGWQDLNEMTQGGFRRGETIMIGALQHKYKTGFTLSLFKQIALYNKPHMLQEGKKPLLLRISFEDDLNLNLQFLYQNLKYDETKQPVSIRDVSIEEMSRYVRERLQVNGYHIKMLRVDPTQWTYKHICNKIIELEAAGYELHLVACDYLFMLPTTGCVVSGPMGSDKRDMLRRMRNFCSAKKITFVTPVQLSSEARQLIRNGMPEERFVKEISEKGFFDGSRSLAQEVDLEMYIHVAKHNKETYLTVQRGKHRVPSIIDDEKKYFLLKFPKSMPISDDVGDEHHAPMRKLPVGNANTGEDLFSFA